jgi:thiamine pyrophosphokinase
MNALIIINGNLPEIQHFEQDLNSADLILCADGGANQAITKSIKPDFVIGDLDSIKPEFRSKLKESQLIFRPSQYATDLEKTLQFALEKGVKQVTLIGVSGGRLDHQICNLNIIEKFSHQLEIKIIDNTGNGRFIRSNYEFEGKIGQQISLFAFRKTEGIKTQGLKYPIQNSSMEWAVNDGLSNEIVSNPVKISVEKGCLFIFQVWC